MRSIMTPCVVAVSMLWGATDRVRADTKAELVSTALVWDQANHATHPDLIRFGDRWFLACQESATAGWPGGTVRILTSKDGKAWESAALLESPTPKRGLFTPRFTTTLDKQLMVTAIGFPGPITDEGGTQKSMAWVSKDGRAWDKPALLGLDDFPLGRLVWHDGIAFSPAIGRICGSVQTVHLMASKDGKAFESRAEEYMRLLAPYEGELLFEGDTAYCLMTGYSLAVPTAVLGTAKAPYKKWDWKQLDQQVRLPNFLRLPDKRVLATVGLYDQKKFRTALCEFQPSTGKFTELLELSTAELPAATGLAWHDGHLWVSYAAAEKDKVRVHLAKVKVK